MPIRFELQGESPPRGDRLRNVSEGGVCFASGMALDAGIGIRLLIPVFGKQFEIDGIVAWCQPGSAGYEIGVRFLSPQDLFCIRMVEQLCYIEDYRLQVEREEGRRLSSEQAAEEWVEHFSRSFPQLL